MKNLFNLLELDKETVVQLTDSQLDAIQGGKSDGKGEDPPICSGGSTTCIGYSVSCVGTNPE